MHVVFQSNFTQSAVSSNQLKEPDLCLASGIRTKTFNIALIVVQVHAQRLVLGKSILIWEHFIGLKQL